MGTRGLWAIRKGGKDKAAYNHWDSYPTGLGDEVINFIKRMGVAKLNNLFDLIVTVDEDSSPTKEQIGICKRNGWYDKSVSSGSDHEWYCLLRNLQGNFKDYEKAQQSATPIFMIQRIDFIRDSIFCEYAYIINLDNNTLEYYVGAQRRPQNGNRYGVTPVEEDYYPCRMVKSYDLAEVMNRDTESLVRDMNKADDEDGGEVFKVELKEKVTFFIRAEDEYQAMEWLRNNSINEARELTDHDLDTDYDERIICRCMPTSEADFDIR